MPWRDFIVSTNCAPQKVDPALIARFIPALFSCFAPIDPTTPPASYELGEAPSGQTIVKPTALGPVANTDTKLLIYGLFQKGRLRVSRPKLVSFFAKQSAATVLLEACGSAHFWARTLRRLGHDVVLLPPHLVRPYRRGSKNDRADTKALLEAYRNEELLPVPIKSVRQHTLAALHRLRSGWLSTRTARINAVRGILRELGFIIPKGAHFVVPALFELVEDADSDLPDVLPFASP